MSNNCKLFANKFMALYNRKMSNKIAKSMIMAAGIGSRLNPVTLEVPKPLVSVCNRPVMDTLLIKLKNMGITDVICNTHYLSEQIIDRYERDCFGLNFNYIKEDELSGTAGGLKKCQFFFDNNEDFIVMSADGLCDADLSKGIEIHKKSGCVATIGIKSIDKKDVSHFGVVVTDSQGKITEFQEKPSVEDAKSNFINTGIYIFNYKIFDYIPQNQFYDFAKNVFPQLLKEKQLMTFEVNGYWSDIGTLAQYKLSTEDVFNRKCNIEHAQIRNSELGRYITNSELPMNTKIIGICTIGANCTIGNNVVIKNSIILDNVFIEDNSTIENSIIASNCNIKGEIFNKVIGNEKLISA